LIVSGNIGVKEIERLIKKLELDKRFLPIRMTMKRQRPADCHRCLTQNERGRLNGAASTQVMTELVNDFPQVGCVLFDHSLRLLHGWRFWLFRFFAIMFARLTHDERLGP